MNPNQLKQLEKLSKVFNTSNIISPEDIQEVLKGISLLLADYRKGTVELTEDVKKTFEDVINTISNEHDKILKEVKNTSETAKSEATEAITKAISEMKRMCAEVMEMKPKDGEKGEDADEEKIIEEVLAKIKLPEYKEVVLDDGAEIISKINDEKVAKINASQIEGLPTFEGKSNGGGWRNLNQLHDVNLSNLANNDVLKYNSTTELWENGVGGGGATAFTDLTDVPSSYSGQAGKAVRVNVGETGLEFFTASGGAPGGSDTQLQYNNAGAFAGMAGTAWDDTNRALTITGATITTSSKPILNLTQTWNDGAVTFEGLKLNITDTASAAASELLDLQVGGVSKTTIAKTGAIKAALAGTNAAPAIAFQTPAGVEIGFWSGVSSASLNMALTSNVASFTDYSASAGMAGGFYVGATREYGWSSTSTIFGTKDVLLVRDAAGTLAQRNGTNAQTFRVYDTYTDASNNAYLELNAGAAGDWLQIRGVTNGTGGDNYGIALSPTGTGAISAHVPDSTAAGGNARGANAVDWQTARTAAAQVASGLYATITGGYTNTASGDYSVASGRSAVASAYGGTVGGGNTNTASGSGYATVAGGYSNTASGTYAWVPGGYQATTRGLSGAGAYSSGARSAQGDAQVILQPVRRTTTDATPVSLATDGTPGAKTVMVLPNTSGGVFVAYVTAISGANVGGWKIEGTIYRGANAAATALIGTTTITTFGVSAALSTCVVDVVADTTLGAAVIQVTGVAATTIQWVGKLELVQVL